MEIKPNVIVRMGAAHWDAQVRGSDGNMTHMNFRKMDKKARSTFHRELMNAFRQTLGVAQ
jgi:hypothetical protein